MNDKTRVFYIFLSLINVTNSKTIEIDTLQTAREYYKSLEDLETIRTVPDTTSSDTRPIFISLGFNCECAYQLSKRNLHGAFFPLDWVKTKNFDLICSMIENDFRNFLDKTNLIIQDKPCGSCAVVVDKKYMVEFLHDFPLDQKFESSYEVVKEKYGRRIARFCNALTTRQHVYFFRRKNITRAQAIKFCTLIRQKAPGLQFTLIALHNTDEYKRSWNIKNIINFFYQPLDTKKLTWRGDNKFWDLILKKLGIKSNNLAKASDTF
ncbi:MAG: DUF1796 family putative cysteine peptidase [Candidatus Babeliales bacterium]|jgi:hypothetical protein